MVKATTENPTSTENPIGSKRAARESSGLLSWLVKAGIVLAGAAALAGSWWGTEFQPLLLLESLPRVGEFLGRMVPPDLSVADLVARACLETVAIAYLGTVLGLLLAFPLGFLAASNLMPWWVYHPTKVLLGVIRSVPLILLAMLFVVAVGLGPFPGVLAIAFHSVGMLGKFCAEEFESTDRRIVEAVEGTGASRAQVLRFGILPQVIPQIISFSLFRLELNLRDATILGLVGAGGIGYYITLYIRGFQYDKVAALCLVIFAMVIAVDLLAYLLRRRVL